MLQADREFVQFFWGCVVGFFWLFVGTGGLFIAFHWSWSRLHSWHDQDIAERVANMFGRAAIVAFGMMLMTSVAACWFSASTLKDPVVWVRAGR